MILYAAADLLWATRIKETCNALGVASRPVRTVEMLEARLGDSEPRGLIVDLETGEVGLALIRRLRAEPGAVGGLPIVAFGPHVAAELFEAAREAGATRAMARGAFADRLGDVVAWLEGSGSDEPRGGE